MLHAVPRDERDAPAAHVADDRRGRGAAVRRIDVDRLDALQKRIEPGAAEDADVRCGAHDSSFAGFDDVPSRAGRPEPDALRPPDPPDSFDRPILRSTRSARPSGSLGSPRPSGSAADPPESPDWEPEEELDDDPAPSLPFEVRCAASEDVDSLSLAFARLSVE